MKKFLEKARGNRVYSFGKDLYDRTMRDDVAGLAAQLAYFFLLAIFPGLVFLITLLGFIPIQTEDVLSLLEAYVPEDAMNLIEVNVDKVVNEQNGGLLSFGLLSTLWFASNGVNAVMNAFNRAYDVKETRSFIATRALSIVLTLAMIFMIVFALIVPVFGQVIGAAVFKALGLSESFSFVWSIIRLVASFLVLFALFSFLYTFAPDRKLKRREVISGALFATVGWILVSYSFAYYVDKFANYANTYGGLGGIIILMLWFYLTAWVILLGGEINGLLHFYRTSDNNSRDEK
ncbi:YihY/virulence factor BrkB family protein [Bacillus cereus group sp. N21]|uniref:YihY/virulence factor BrkB family protein n=1 Tax=Bacillus cereus group sp. N21 TaxID=2794591 RepID=UPI0018F79D34|nr:YihY/virulence factor BrkB family protein [Bacillus cereus group sp. N21]MBJ8031271.1 YihY/virulence factor BrkB family protein [Bacillus cereus group sp. N21]